MIIIWTEMARQKTGGPSRARRLTLLGTRVFGLLCWDLDEQGATDAILRPAANQGTRVFSEKCWYLEAIAETLTG